MIHHDGTTINVNRMVLKFDTNCSCDNRVLPHPSVVNNFDLMFRFYLPDTVAVNRTYDIASIVYPGQDGSDSIISLGLVVGEET